MGRLDWFVIDDESLPPSARTTGRSETPGTSPGIIHTKRPLEWVRGTYRPSLHEHYRYGAIRTQSLPPKQGVMFQSQYGWNPRTSYSHQSKLSDPFRSTSSCYGHFYRDDFVRLKSVY